MLYVTNFFMKLYKTPIMVDHEVNAMRSIYRTYNTDIIFPRMDLDEFAWLFSNRDVEKTAGGKEEIDWASYQPEDIIRIPNRADLESSYSVQVLKAAREDKPLQDTLLGAFCPTPYSLVTGIIGLQAASTLLIRNRDFLSALVATAANAIVEYIQVLKEVAGVIVLLAPSECTISRKMYDKSVAAPVQQLVEAVAAGDNTVSFLHFCTRANEHLLNAEVITPLAKAGLMGLNVPNVMHAIPLARDLDLVLLGGIDPIGIQQRPWQEIVQETKVLLEEIKDKGTRFVLGTDCNLTKIPLIEASGTLLTKFLELKKLVKEFSSA